MQEPQIIKPTLTLPPSAEFSPDVLIKPHGHGTRTGLILNGPFTGFITNESIPDRPLRPLLCQPINADAPQLHTLPKFIDQTPSELPQILSNTLTHLFPIEFDSAQFLNNLASTRPFVLTQQQIEHNTDTD